MDSRRPSIRQLEYAVALADAGHFGRAARACHVTQPALSAQIRSLEDELGVRLFERSRRGATPTPVGRWFVLRARGLLEGIDELTEVARGSREPLVGPLRMGVIPTVAPYLLMGWLPPVREAWPRLRLFLREERTDRLLDQLAQGELDLLLLALPVDRTDALTFPIFREPFLLLAPRDHALARGRGALREEDLDGHGVLLLEDGHCLRDQALEVCAQAGREVETGGDFRATSIETLRHMVAAGLGVTLLPSLALPRRASRKGPVAIPFTASAAARRRIALVWRRTHPKGPDLALLAEFIREHSPDEVATR